MLITDEEKVKLAQFYFDKCFKGHYSICGISDFYNIISPNGKNLYENKEDKKLLNYKDLSHFHTISFEDFPKETFIKLVTATKNIFGQLGYVVDTSKQLG